MISYWIAERTWRSSTLAGSYEGKKAKETKIDQTKTTLKLVT